MKIKRLFSVFLPSILTILAILAAVFIFFAVKDRQKANQENLAAFYEMTSQDPLFYSPFFNKNDFEAAINGLAESEAFFKKSAADNLKLEANANEAWHGPILENARLFPFRFLNSLTAINSKTEEFLKNPSPKQARNLLALYDGAADSYLESVSALIDGLKQTEKKKMLDYYFFFVDNVSSVNVAKNDLLAIQANGRALKEEIKKRRKCLLDKTFCRISAPKDTADFVDSLNAEFNLKGGKIDFIKSTLRSAPQEEIKGPYEIVSSCWQNPDSKQWLYLVFYEEDGKTLLIPKLANQSYYRKIVTGAKGWASDRILSEKNIDFIRMVETNNYQCLDLTFYPRLLALDFIKSQIDAKKITIGDLSADPQYRLLMENQFGLLAPTINRIARNLKSLGLNLEINKLTLPPEYLLLVRSDYSLFYFPFAKSIWRIDEQPRYFVPAKEQPEKKSDYSTLDDLKNLGYTYEDIKKFNISNLIFYEDILRGR